MKVYLSFSTPENSFTMKGKGKTYADAVISGRRTRPNSKFLLVFSQKFLNLLNRLREF